MLTMNLKRIARKKGWTNVREALVKGGIEHQKAWRMATGRMKKWEVKDIERLCEIFKCSPNDLFVLELEKGKRYGPEHPMRELLRINESTDVVAFLKTQPMARVKLFEEMMLKIRMEDLANRKKPVT